MDSQKIETEQPNTATATPDVPDQSIQDVAMPIKAEAGQNKVVEAPQEEAEPTSSLQPEGAVAAAPVAPKKPAKVHRPASALPLGGITVASLVLLSLISLAYIAYIKKG